jgi:hypothetical protein
MKKVLVIFAFLLGGMLCMNAQGTFRIGAHLGLPTGDTSDFSNFTYGLDGSYLWPIDDMFSAGVATGYSSYSGKDDYDNYSFIPIAATGRADFAETWFGALDLGYAIATSDNGDGGFYYQPKIGWSDGKVDVFVFYQGISVKDATFDVSAFGVGGAFKL